MTSLFIGVILIAVSLYFLYSNEIQAVRSHRLLDETLRACHTMDTTVVSRYRPNFLVYASGPISSKDPPVSDDALHVRAPVLRLRREVEALQWRETGTPEQPHYEQVWAAEVLDSSRYHDTRHQNPQRFKLPSATLSANRLRIGEYSLDPRLVALFEGLDLAPLDPALLGGAREFTLHNGHFYSGSPERPKIGDVRVSYLYAGVTIPNSLLGPQSTASAIGGVTNSSIAPYYPPRGPPVGSLVLGHASKEYLFGRATAETTQSLYMYRAASFGGLALALWLLRGTLQAALGWIPIIHRITRRSSPVFALLLAAVLTLALMAAVWASYWVYSSMLALAAAALFIIGIRTGSKEAAQ